MTKWCLVFQKVCTQSKSCELWSVLVTAVRQNFYFDGKNSVSCLCCTFSNFTTDAAPYISLGSNRDRSLQKPLTNPSGKKYTFLAGDLRLPWGHQLVTRPKGLRTEKQYGKRQQLSNNSTRRGAETHKSSLYWTQCLDQTQSRVINYSVTEKFLKYFGKQLLTKVQILCCGGKQMRQGFPLWLFYQSLIYVYFPHQHLSNISSPQVDNVSMEGISEQVDTFDIVIHSNIHLC